jgi:signal transduction histidine kinase
MLAASLTGGTQEPIQEYLSGIQKGCDRLSLLVNGLIMVIELRTGEMLSRFEQQARVLGNLGEIWARAGQQQMAQAAKDEVTLEINVPDDLPPAYGMEEAIGIIAEQLIDNAIKFCTLESIITRQVTLSARADDDSIYLVVSDTGIGIPDEVLENVFDLFYQHDRDRYEQQGAGIGLTISQELARLHGGRIDVDSHSGIGSTFSFVIPRRESRPPLSPGVEAKLKRLSTILVVEDDPYLREGLCDLIELTEKPFDLRTINASNGAHALQVMAETRPDLIISDIMMPVMDGYEFLRKVRSNPDWVQIPFVFLTAKGEEKDIHRGLQMGVEDYITKPYNSDVIMSMVAVLLRRYYQVQDVLQRNFSSFKRSILGLLTPKVREPLDSVTQYSAQVANELGTASSEIELKHSLQGLQASSQQLFRIVEDFILLAEIKTGEALVAFSYQAMVISPTHEFFQQLFMQHDPMHELDVHVHVEQFPTLPGIYGDPSALEKIVQLLLSASVAICNEYEQDTIYVSASHSEGKIWISVECSNIHLPTREVSSLERLFDTGDEALLTEVEYGAAIAVVNGLLGLHSGSVKIDNEAHGGCTFTIFLPVHQE